MTSSVRYGPQPWPQSFWDARAAANFVCGGLGAGLIVAAALAAIQGQASAVPLIVGLTIVACGLVAVFSELGRPLRAANVVVNPRTSWMTREALVAPLLFAAGVLAAAGWSAFVPLAALLALAFVYCQGRMVHAARGIPAWRAREVPWLFMATGLAEGAGLWLVIAALAGHRSGAVAALCAIAVIARYAIFRFYCRGLAGIAADAVTALDRAGRWLLYAGTLAVLVLLALAAAAGATWLAAAAGVLSALAGVWLKATLVLRAGHTQGFALPALPVRGTRR